MVAQQLNSFNLMVARKEYIQYIWFGIQFLYMQGELIQKVIETTENEIKTLLVPYYRGDEKREKLRAIEWAAQFKKQQEDMKEEEKKRRMEDK